MTTARSRAARKGWDDPLSHALHSNAIREGWSHHRQRVAPVSPPVFNVFRCPCGSECIGTWSGPHLCSTCRAVWCS